MKTSFNISISESLSKELDELVQSSGRSRIYHVNEALKFYLKEDADLQVAYDRLQDSTDLVVSMVKMKKILKV
jgi:predicted DNA-binding protein